MDAPSIFIISKVPTKQGEQGCVCYRRFAGPHNFKLKSVCVLEELSDHDLSASLCHLVDNLPQTILHLLCRRQAANAVVCQLFTPPTPNPYALPHFATLKVKGEAAGSAGKSPKNRACSAPSLLWWWWCGGGGLMVQLLSSCAAFMETRVR